MRDLLSKKGAVEALIRSRHAALVAVADELKDQALNSLHDVCRDDEERLRNELDEQRHKGNTLQELQRQVNSALQGQTDVEMLAAAKELADKQPLLHTVYNKKETVVRPMLKYSAGVPLVRIYAEKFLGSVIKAERNTLEDRERVEEKFSCGDHTGEMTEVLSVCPTGMNSVWLSFTKGSCEERNMQGALLNVTGGCGGSFKCISQGTKVYHQNGCASKSSENSYYWLEHDKEKGGATVLRAPRSTPETTFFLTAMTAGVQMRAFDADCTGTLFATVVEPNDPLHWSRCVKLFQPPAQDQHMMKSFFKILQNLDMRGANAGEVVGEYEPPQHLKPTFQPADVCFCISNDQKVGHIDSSELFSKIVSPPLPAIALHVTRVP
jgi:hypothetical protein